MILSDCDCPFTKLKSISLSNKNASLTRANGFTLVFVGLKLQDANIRNKHAKS